MSQITNNYYLWKDAVLPNRSFLCSPQVQISMVYATICLGLLLRLYQITADFDVDEIFTVKAISGSWSQMIDSSIQDRNHPPLHNALLFFWIKVFGNSEISVRIVSVLASAIFLFFLYKVALRITNELGALFVVAIAAISPFFVYYGQQARVYSMVSAFIILSVYFLMKSQEQPNSEKWEVLYGISCAALMHSQYMGALIIGFELLAIGAFKLRNRVSLIASGLAGTLSILLWLYVVGVGVNPANVAITFWLEKPDWADLPTYYLQIFGLLPIAGTSRILMILLALLVGSLLYSWRTINWMSLFSLAVVVVFPVVTVWAISRYGPISVWAPRQLMGSAIAFICLIGLAIGMHRQWVGITLGTALLGWCLLALPDAFPEHTKTPWRSIVKLLDQNAANYEIVAVDSWVADPLRFYSTGTEIFGWKEWERRLGKTDRILFVCRPVRCKERSHLDAQYRPTAVKEITWKREKNAPSSTIQISFLERIHR